jgi:D-methionine transport system permease protein
MAELLEKLVPHVIVRFQELLLSTWQTLYMTGLTGIISFLFGLLFGIILTIARKDGILENQILYSILDKVINFFRSIPFIILLVLLIPISRFVSGTAIGTRGVMVPLIFGTIPFFSRQIETALAEIDRGAIEAAKSMGTSPLGIIFRVYLKESIPGIIRGVTITFISLIGLTAMAGAVGGGGLGDFAIRYGYQRYQTDITVVTVIVLVLIVTIIQKAGDFFSRKLTR